MSNEIVKRFDQVFLESDKTIKPVPFKWIDSLTDLERRTYCHYKAIYGIITTELVELISGLIMGYNAIEIGSGNGTLGKALHIPCTDNCMQRDMLDVKLFYKLGGQPTIDYPSHIEKIPALEAIEKYKPHTVVASWVTHKYDKENHSLGGNMYGVEEKKMFDLGIKRYVLLGNLKTHAKKPILNDDSFKVVQFQNPFIVSRASDKSKDRLFIITKK